jgi:hypothetical protein
MVEQLLLQFCDIVTQLSFKGFQKLFWEGEWEEGLPAIVSAATVSYPANKNQNLPWQQITFLL